MANSSEKTRSSGATRKSVAVYIITLLVLIVLLALTIFLLIWFLKPKDPVIQTEYGRLKGKVRRSPGGPMVEEFLGIPFAKPPIGERRYADPEPLESFSQDPYPAYEYGKTCIGYIDTAFEEFQGSDMWNAKTGLSEDCLYLNVWAPSIKKESKLAVMVWIFGGGFYSGSSALWIYDGKSLAGHGDVIVVSMNYRVGSLGFLSSGDWRIKGNFGLRDQWLALKWVKDNIGAFGGDPDRITIFGESAGASSVGYHLLAKESQPLFHRAIFQSGSPDSHWSYMNSITARQRSAQMFANLGCEDNNDVIYCLRSKTSDEIAENDWVTAKYLEFPWAPTVDGTFIKQSPYEILYTTKSFPTDKEVLVGVNKDEGTFWLLYTFDFLSKDTESLVTAQEFHNSVDTIDWDLNVQERQQVRNRYQPADPIDGAQNRDALDDITGDRTFICPTYELAKQLGGNGVKTFFYQLTYRASNEVWPPWMGVIHGADIQWIFGMPLNRSRGYNDKEMLNGYPETKSYDEINLAFKIMSYWTNFAKTGDPNGYALNTRGAGKLPQWPSFAVDSRPLLQISGSADRDFIVEDATRQYGNTCSFWWNYHEAQQRSTG